MPRRSLEDLSGELWRGDGDPIPPPPPWMKGDARKIFLEIVEYYPGGRFPPGAMQLLESFCFVSALLRDVMRKLQATAIAAPESRRLSGQMVKLSGIQLSTATKLKLTPSATWRHDAGRLQERRLPQSRLLGGAAMGGGRKN